jgi:hypothetical protein
MSEIGYPRSAAEVVATLGELFINQQNPELAELLERAVSYIEQTDYDNWNGGTYYWALRLEVPVSTYAKFENNLEAVEAEIAKKLELLDRVYPRDHLSSVTIFPISSATAAFGKKVAPSSLDTLRLWGDRKFKLFLSHVSAHKVSVGKLGDGLSIYGVSAFVAHDDIEPSLEWRDEIEIALRSMDALAALVTPEFHASFWTDQEVGWAFGRGVLALPVMLGATPYGFLVKFQGVPGGDLERPGDLAALIVKALLRNRQTYDEMRRALIAAFTVVVSYEQARLVSKLLVKLTAFTDEEKARIWQAYDDNGQIKDSFGVREALVGAIGNQPSKKVDSREDGIPF